MLVFPFALLASHVEPELSDGKIVAASLFKNGYAVIVREVPFLSGRAEVRPPLSSVLGTLWVSTSQGVTLSKVWSGNVETKSEREVESLDELLQANLEKNVTLETSQGNNSQTTVVKGRIISSRGNIVVLEQEKDRIALFKSAILRVLAAEHGLNFRLPQTTSERAIHAEGKGDGKMYLVSMQRGITWAPAYQVDLVDEKSLKITAKATILNDLAPLSGVDVNLVTGFPNIKFINAFDPLTSGATVDQFVQGLAYSVTDEEYKRDAMTQNRAPAFDKGGFVAALPPTGSGTQLEDLFLYKQPSVSLKPGERGYYILFEATSKYESIYTVDVPDAGAIFEPAERMPESDDSLDVWHTLQFVNTAKQPLTTAPVVTMKGGEVLGQDLVNYTSAGAKAKVRVTLALDIHAEAIDEEVSRERGFIKTNNRPSYDKVSLKGTIELSNHKSNAVQMEVNKTATGEVTSSGGADVRKLPKGLRQMNPVSQLSWKLSLKPGETKLLTYNLDVLVPSRD